MVKNKEVYVTINYDDEAPSGAGWPVAVYATREEADKAVARSKAAYETLFSAESSEEEKEKARKDWTEEDYVRVVKSFL